MIPEVQLWHSPHVTERVPVGTIYGVGSNYAAHIAEMKGKPAEEPVIFIKPATALVSDQTFFEYPHALTRCLHHEVEMVLLVGQSLWQATPEQAVAAIAGVGVGLDLTLRDRQQQAKAQGRPWSVAKGFRQSAPVSLFLPPSQLGDLQALELTLWVNHEVRQQGNTRHMLYSVVELLCYLSSVFPLRRGDLIFTGTPEGVAELHPGNQLDVTLSGHAAIRQTWRVQGRTV